MAQAAHGSNYLNAQKGLWSWLTTLDHKRIGILYFISVMTFFLMGGIAALLLRGELFAYNAVDAADILKDFDKNTVATAPLAAAETVGGVPLEYDGGYVERLLSNNWNDVKNSSVSFAGDATAAAVGGIVGATIDPV